MAQRSCLFKQNQHFIFSSQPTPTLLFEQTELSNSNTSTLLHPLQLFLLRLQRRKIPRHRLLRELSSGNHRIFLQRSLNLSIGARLIEERY
jgi:hypothetical protein